VDRELFLALHFRAERLSFDVRHHVEEQPFSFARIEERKQIRVLEIRGDLDFRQEALDTEHRTELRIQDLERNSAIVLDVAREIHGRHAAAPDLAVDGVAAGKCGGELSESVHATAWREGGALTYGRDRSVARKF